MWRYACALALLCAALARAHAHKRAEMSPMPFVLGSRYGRSPPRVMSPRNDRFFMGSRYGKRSEAAGEGGEEAGGGWRAPLCACAPVYPRVDYVHRPNIYDRRALSAPERVRDAD